MESSNKFEHVEPSFKHLITVALVGLLACLMLATLPNIFQLVSLKARVAAILVAETQARAGYAEFTRGLGLIALSKYRRSLEEDKRNLMQVADQGAGPSESMQRLRMMTMQGLLTKLAESVGGHILDVYRVERELERESNLDLIIQSTWFELQTVLNRNALAAEKEAVLSQLAASPTSSFQAQAIAAVNSVDTSRRLSILRPPVERISAQRLIARLSDITELCKEVATAYAEANKGIRSSKGVVIKCSEKRSELDELVRTLEQHIGEKSQLTVEGNQSIPTKSSVNMLLLGLPIVLMFLFHSFHSALVAANAALLAREGSEGASSLIVFRVTRMRGIKHSLYNFVDFSMRWGSLLLPLVVAVFSMSLYFNLQDEASARPAQAWLQIVAAGALVILCVETTMALSVYRGVVRRLC